MKCEGCLRSDCGTYLHCIDMKKFGGPGKRKKGCMNRKCNGLNQKIIQF